MVSSLDLSGGSLFTEDALEDRGSDMIGTP